MKVLRVEDQEDCFDGSIMKIVVFDQPVDKSLIHLMGKNGELAYFPSFARPFFKIEVKGHYYIKGIENNKTISLILYKRNPPESLKLFLSHIDQILNKSDQSSS